MSVLGFLGLRVSELGFWNLGVQVRRVKGGFWGVGFREELRV